MNKAAMKKTPKVTKPTTTKAVAKKVSKKVTKTATKRTLTTKRKVITTTSTPLTLAPMNAFKPQFTMKNIMASPLRQSTRKIVTELGSPDDARQFITEKGSGKKLTVVDFYADWCGPCRALGPKFKQMSDDFPQVAFAKINADEFASPDIDDAYPEVTALPTVMFFVDGKHVDTVVGLNTDKILANVQKLGV